MRISNSIQSRQRATQLLSDPAVETGCIPEHGAEADEETPESALESTILTLSAPLPFSSQNVLCEDMLSAHTAHKIAAGPTGPGGVGLDDTLAPSAEGVVTPGEVENTAASPWMSPATRRCMRPCIRQRSSP